MIGYRFLNDLEINKNHDIQLKKQKDDEEIQKFKQLTTKTNMIEIKHNTIANTNTTIATAASSSSSMDKISRKHSEFQLPIIKGKFSCVVSLLLSLIYCNLFC